MISIVVYYVVQPQRRGNRNFVHHHHGWLGQKQINRVTFSRVNLNLKKYSLCKKKNKLKTYMFSPSCPKEIESFGAGPHLLIGFTITDLDKFLG